MTQTIATPQEHSSLVGGSTAARRIGCPGSYKLEQKVPKSKGSAYAREGTALHEMMAIILDQDKLPEDLLPFTHHQPAKGPDEAWSLTVDQELWDDLGEPALEAFDQFVNEIEAETGEPFDYIVEKSCEFPGIAGAFGTSDILWKCGDLRGVVDWKFGRNPVAAEGNKQGMFYMLAALNTFPAFFGEWASGDEFIISIIQPRDSGRSKDWRLDAHELDEFRDTLYDAVKEAQGPNPKIEKGPWCNFADCKAICPHHLGAAARLGELMKEKEAHKESPSDTFDLSSFLAEAMEIADDVEAWAKAVASMTQEYIDNGGKVAGWKTVDKRSSGRDWHPELTEDQIKQRLSYRGLKIDEYAPRKLVTPPAAEKLLKKVGKELPEDTFIKKPSSGTTLAREEDNRQAAKRPVDTTAALAAALAEKNGEK